MFLCHTTLSMRNSFYKSFFLLLKHKMLFDWSQIMLENTNIRFCDHHVSCSTAVIKAKRDKPNTKMFWISPILFNIHSKKASRCISLVVSDCTAHAGLQTENARHHHQCCGFPAHLRYFENAVAGKFFGLVFYKPQLQNVFL